MATSAGPQLAVLRHQKHARDFFYEDELIGMKADGVLTRLSLACRVTATRNSTSRTACARQAAMCGRGSRTGPMSFAAPSPAQDVERALVDLAAHGARSIDEAVSVADLKKKGRYHQDVY